MYSIGSLQREMRCLSQVLSVGPGTWEALVEPRAGWGLGAAVPVLLSLRAGAGERLPLGGQGSRRIVATP